MRLLLLAFPAFLACTVPAGAQPGASPSLDQLVERMVTRAEAMRPDYDSTGSMSVLAGERLIRLNPGREAETRPLAEAAGTCMARTIDAEFPLAARRAARALGEEKLVRLIAFLERLESGNRGTPAENLAAIEDHQDWVYSIRHHTDPAVQAQLAGCVERMLAEADRLKLRMD